MLQKLSQLQNNGFTVVQTLFDMSMNAFVISFEEVNIKYQLKLSGVGKRFVTVQISKVVTCMLQLHYNMLSEPLIITSVQHNPLTRDYPDGQTHYPDQMVYSKTMQVHSPETKTELTGQLHVFEIFCPLTPHVHAPLQKAAPTVGHEQTPACIIRSPTHQKAPSIKTEFSGPVQTELIKIEYYGHMQMKFQTIAFVLEH
ncbi:Hypothetical_protein [Hexamita inflata]|uniref:Hypothetical_protein n=1 Tax=Hexamita inflata TaxID=28002 RepID=A0AA86VNP8_9EUKA|nr:Hypothetical protein HINF_LOCUS59253 [Hexamita inflata]